jgi:enamine deaminase RidA (YjgF/YER057c/UK114 family)
MRHLLALACLAAVPAVTFAQSARQVYPNANPNSPFSAAVKADGLIYVSGTLGSTGDIKAQTKQVLESINATLKTAGSSLANAVAMTVYIRNQADFAGMNEAYRPFWTKDLPTRTTVVMPLLNQGLVEIAAVAVPDGAERVVITPAGWGASPNPYSYGIRTGGTLFISGLTSRNPKDYSPALGDMATQTKNVMDNGAAILKAAGMSYSDVVSSRVYISDDKAFQAMNNVYRTYFPSNPPARATVKARLNSDDYIIEVTMVAVSGAKKAINTPGEDGKPGTANPNLSSAIQVGNRLYVAGITGNTASNKGDVKAQANEALARIGRTLKAAGYDFSDIVDATVYLPDLTKFADMNAAYIDKLVKDRPARATVGSGLMGADAAVEIMFTAVK